VFKLFDTVWSIIFLRSVSPKLFKCISFLGFVNLGFSFICNYQIYLYLVSGLTSVLALICLAIIPNTNGAKDENNPKLFRLLHSISVILTMIILALNISLIFILNIN